MPSYTDFMSCFQRGCLVVVGSIVLASVSSAYVLIDDFTGGYFKATITGQGNQDNLATELDTNHVFAGHRNTDYIANANVNQMNYVSTFEVGLGEARVITPGPTDMSTELYINYGTGYFEPMNMDVFGDDRFEVDLETEPAHHFAEVWSIRVVDGHGKTATCRQPGLTDTGIRFLKQNFVGQTVDWSDIDELSFRQSWNAQGTAPLAYWATEIRSVPEPIVWPTLLGLVAIGARGRKRRPRA